MPNVLFIYSNPADTTRLRLDKEHRAIETIISELRLNPSHVRRLHATTLADLGKAIQDEQFELVHFSGHGSEEGIYLESEDGGQGVLVSAETISKALQQASTTLRGTVFMSCFSADQTGKLLNIAPYLITVVGAAGDSAAIKFTEAFYRSYFRDNSIELAFRNGLTALEIESQGEFLKPVLSRRGRTADEGLVVEVFPLPRRDSLLVDLTEAKQSIANLKIPPQDFLSILTRKIRIHRWIFETPISGTFLPIGQFFGEFSWSDGRDVIKCHKVVAIRDEVSEETCNVWASLVVNYNDLRSARYRSPDEFTPNLRNLKSASDRFNDTYRFFFEDERQADHIRSICPQEFKSCKAALNSNLWMAEAKVHQEDSESCVQYLEVALSSLHDLVNAVASRVLRSTEGTR